MTLLSGLDLSREYGEEQLLALNVYSYVELLLPALLFPFYLEGLADRLNIKSDVWQRAENIILIFLKCEVIQIIKK